MSDLEKALQDEGFDPWATISTTHPDLVAYLRRLLTRLQQHEATIAEMKVESDTLWNHMRATSPTALEARVKHLEKIERVAPDFIREILDTLKANPLPVPITRWQRHQWQLEQLAAFLGPQAQGGA